MIVRLFVRLFPIILLILAAGKIGAQCPNLTTNATLSSPDCTPGSTPCDVCPGDQITLTPFGTNLPPGGCVDWYYGTTNNFNPYNGQGTYLGCSPIPNNPPPTPCDDCPLTLLIYADACGTEQDNEWMALWSGSGFDVDQLTVDLAPGNNVGAGNGDPGSMDCPWQEPTPGAIASVQSICNGATVIGVGPGESVPPGVPVIIFMSAGLSFNYNWGGLCPLSPTIYVMQNGCTRTTGAFTNSAGIFTITTSLSCGCSDVTTYSGSLLLGGNGAFVVDAGLPLPIYGNAPCGSAFPNIPWNPPPPPPVNPDPLVVTITPDMCNGGPYWAVGIVDPLAGGCPQDFTNYLQYNVICPDPQLLTADLCTGSGLFDLNQLEDPMWPNGTWSGPGVSGNNFNPIGQNGTVQLTFTPNYGPCSDPVSTSIEVSSGPTAMFQPLGPVCDGATEDVVINFTGNGPWEFSLSQSGTPLGDFTTSDNPFSIPVTFNATSTIGLTNLSTPACNGQNASMLVSVISTVEADINLAGPSQICPGQFTQLSVSFTGGAPPYTFVYDLNGVPQSPITTNNNPYSFSVNPTSDATYSLSSVEANGCIGNASGFVNITVTEPSDGALSSGTTTVCPGQQATLHFDFNGTPPFIFVYSLNGINQPPITTSNTSYNLTVTPPPGNNVYELVSMSGGSCPGTVTGEHTVVVQEAPEVTLSGDATLCGSGTTTLTFDFNGTGPFTVNYTANGVPQTPITTSNLSYNLTVTPSQTTTYTATAVSANGCTGTATGTAIVTLDNPLTATLSGGGQICVGGTGTSLTVTFVGDGPYTFVYKANNVAQPAITTNSNPYTIPVNPTAGTNYQLVSVTNGQCNGSVSGSVWVFVFTPPTAEMLPLSQTFCGSANTQIEINLTGTGPFTLTYSANGVTQPPIQTSEDPYFLPVNVSSTTVYELLTVQSPGCSNTATGMATIEVNTAPSFAGQHVTCDQAAGTYIVEFDAANFEAPLTLVSGAGSFSANGHFTSAPIPLGTNSYSIVWHDNNNCGNITVSGLANCNCTTFAGTMNLAPDTACVNEPVMAFFNNNAVLDANDTLLFLLHTNPGTPIGQILAWRRTPSFPFFPPMQPNVVYYISAVAGDPIAPGIVDLADPCVSISQGTPVMWKPLPTAMFVGNDTVCIGQPASLQLNFTGTPPFTFTYALNGIPQPPVVSHPLPSYTVVFSPTQTTDVQLISLEDGFCVDGGNATAKVVVQSCGCFTNAGNMNQTLLRPCEDSEVTAPLASAQNLDANDTLMYILHTMPGGNPLGQILAWNSIPRFSLLPGMTAGTTYYISAIAGDPLNGQVNLADTCLSVAFGTPVIWEPKPTVALTAPTLGICPGELVQVPIGFGGTGPFTVTYAIDGVAQMPVANLPGPTYVFNLTPAQNTTITLVAANSTICASGNLVGETDIEIYGKPLISNLATDCDEVNNVYTVTFEVVGGVAPFTVNGMTGTFSGTTFTSTPIPIGTSYVAQLSDVNHCGVDTRMGTANCGCITDAGTMSQTPVSVCIGQPVVAQQVTPPTEDSNDTLWYVLHTLPGNPLGTILAWRTIPSFQYIPGATIPGTTYYISAVVGNAVTANGFPDLTDPCTSIAIGTPVAWAVPPTATLQNDTFDICPGQSQPLTIVFTGKLNMSFSYSLNNVVTPGISVQSQFTINTTVLQNSTFKLLTVTDANGCTGTATGTAQINVHPRVATANETYACDPFTQTYTVEFDVTAGDLNSLQINGLTGTLNSATGHFVSDPQPASNPNFSIAVSDKWLCGRDTVAGMADCSCGTSAGTMLQASLEFCAQEAAIVPMTNGAFLDFNDTLIYALATAPAPPSWTILQTNTVPTFSFNPMTMASGSTYYIVALAGNASQSAPGIALNDPCFSAAATPVSWKTPVTATLAGTAQICAGDTATLTVTFAGDAPYTFSYLTNGANASGPIAAPSSPFELKVTPSQSSTYTLSGVNGDGCAGTMSGTATVTVDHAPSLLNVVKICDFVNQTYVLKFAISNGAAPNVPYLVNGIVGTLNDTIFTSAPISFTVPYDLTVSTLVGCETTLSGVSDCQCTTNAGTLSTPTVTACTSGAAIVQPAGNQSLDSDDGLQFILYQDVALLPNGILAVSNVPQFAFQPGMTAGTTYYVSAVAGNKILPLGNVDLTDPCLSISPSVPVVFVEGPTATLAGDTSVCPGGAAIFNVNFTGTGPFTFVYSLNGTAQPPIQAPQLTFPVASNNVLQNQVFTLISVQNALCPGTATGTATVGLLPVPKADLAGDTSICFGKTANLTFDLSGGATFDVQYSDGSITNLLAGIADGFALQVAPTQTTTYTIQSVMTAGTVCPPKIGPAHTVRVEQVLPTLTAVDQNGFNVGCFGAEDGSATATVQGGNAPYNFEWSNGGFGATQNELAAGQYFVTITDRNGCSAVDSVALTEPPAIEFDWTSKPPRCFGDSEGELTVETVSGGIGPYTLTLVGEVMEIANSVPAVFDQLLPGAYAISVEDVNGCATEKTAHVLDAQELLVDVGPDLQVNLGDSLVIRGVTSAVVFDSAVWSPAQFLSTPFALQTWATPTETTRFRLTVVDTSGCRSWDELVVGVVKQNRVFAPNIISPNGDGRNDEFTIFGGPEVLKINYLRVYDRWGECVFLGNDMAPGDLSQGWKAFWRDRKLLPGVYVFTAEIQFLDGSTTLKKGDITVMR